DGGGGVRRGVAGPGQFNLRACRASSSGAAAGSVPRLIAPVSSRVIVYDTSSMCPYSSAAVLAIRSEKGPFGHDARAPMYYDPVRGHGLLVDFKTGTLWACEPDRTAWAKLQPEGGTMPGGTKRLAHFDLAHNVFVVIHGTTVWADRYKA